MFCPSCRLENPANAIRCDCGFNFQTQAQEGRPQARTQVGGARRSLEEKLVSEMTGAEARKIITSGVANGVLMAGLVLLLLSALAGAALGLVAR